MYVALAVVPMMLSGCEEDGSGEKDEQTDNVTSAANEIRSLLPSDNDARGDIIGVLVRLAFHDAGTWDGATGGADGCVENPQSGENKGLQEAIDMLAPIVSDLSSELSRADVWALAGNVVIEAAGGPRLEFKTGRVDSSDCEGHASRLPDGEQGHSHIEDVFVDRMGFTHREVVALCGAHVLGRARSTNSGYEGKWVRRNDLFTNRYFRDLIDIEWVKLNTRQTSFGPRTVWANVLPGGGPMNFGDEIMLNTDIELAFNRNGCFSAGGPNTDCDRATHSFNQHVDEFAQDQDVFFETFAAAWAKLTAMGALELTCYYSDCHTP